MIIKDIIDEDFVNYKKPSMFIAFPNCTFKCDKLNGCEVCQNAHLTHEPNIEIDTDKLINRYLHNNLTEAVVCAGLEPLDSFDDLFEFIWTFRMVYFCYDDIIIYTGYDREEVEDKILTLSKLPNIIVKFGRFVMNHPHHTEDILGVELASDNQYAVKIS